MGNVIAFRRMNDQPEHRRGPDRRSTRRGGRRTTDKAGYAPLVLIVDDNEDSNARCEAILAKLHFAVAPTRSIEEAARVMDALRPDVIVARVADAAALRQATAADLPIVLLAEDLLDPEALVNEIRRELRAHKSQRRE
jgi:PleD family two-component response regulator